MYHDWTAHLKDPTEKAQFERDVQGAQRILDRMQSILLLKEKSLDVSERSTDSFDRPNWAYRQAFNNGYRSALNYLIKLTDLDQQRDKNDR